MLDKIKRFLDEREKWVSYGKPLRQPERIEELFAICSGCEFFEPKSEGIGRCGECGCNLKKEGTNLNKLAWATTHCPLEEPKWNEEPNLVLERPTETEEERYTRRVAERAEVHAARAIQQVAQQAAQQAAQKIDQQANPPKPKKGGCGCGK